VTDITCRACGAPLAADQRYCLQCGTRHGDARLPFLEILARQMPPAEPATTTTTVRPTGPAAWLGRMSANAAAVAGVGCLLLALGVGVLIGGLGSDDSSAASAGAPQIITVGGSAPAAAVAPVATSSAPAATETTAENAPKAKKKSSASDDATSTSSAVKDLNKTSGSDYAKKAEKLPKTLGTGGAPPPKDTSGKAIGGGSDTEEIG
jgi:pyruvate/2-oxoglutarate dehydrogenase complex dihydrolipoamide acyltransferase (E2) component